MFSLSLEDVLSLVPGHVVTVGGTTTLVTEAAPLDAASREALSFCVGEGSAAADAVRRSEAAIVLCRASAVPDIVPAGRALIVVDEPRNAFAAVLRIALVRASPAGVHPSAILHPEAALGDGVYIGPQAVIGKAAIGDGCHIGAHVVVHDSVRLGKRVKVQTGAVIGADGYGFTQGHDGEPLWFPHIGGVVVGDDVEIGANTVIDRGTLGDTEIGRATKIDNLVHIAHNVVIGEASMIIANAMIGGSVRLGSHCWVAPSSTIRDGVTLGDGVTVGLGAVVVKDVEPGVTVMGAPARTEAEFKAVLRGWRQGAQ